MKSIYTYTAMASALMASAMLHAQNIDHFNQDGTRWYVADVFPNGSASSPSFLQTETTVYGTSGDTLIDGQLWLRLVSGADEALEGPVNEEGYVRSEGLLVHYRNAAGNTSLLYDFSLEVGDSILIEIEDAGQAYSYVTETDFVEINGNPHRRLYFSEPELPTPFMWMDEVWVEGIGSLHGPLFAAAPHWVYGEFNTALELTCTTRNGDTYWNHPDFDDCLVNIINSSTALEELQLMAFPNPFRDELTIEGLGDATAGAAQIRLFDIQGRQVHRAVVPAGQSRLSLGHLRTGIYLLELSTGDAVWHQRIVKHP